MTDATYSGPRKERFEGLDVLRGVAVLGIFAMNIQAFATVYEAYAAPAIQADWGAQGQTLWALSNTWFSVKFITLFSAMFGAGIVLFVGTERNPEREALQRRRLWWLLLIGMIHAYFIWMGDILVSYALAGLMIAGARRWKVRNLIIMGVVWSGVASFMIGGFGWLMTAFGEMIIAQIPADELSMFTPEGAAEQAAVMASPLWERLPTTALKTLEAQLSAILFLPRIIGVMMFGMALYKMGFLTGRWPLWGYLVAILAVAPGWYLSQMGTDLVLASPPEPYWQMVNYFNNTHWLMLGSLFQSFGYAALVMALCKLPVIKLITIPFRAAGRMAFTNYLGTSIAAAFMFFGAPGLGLIGEFTRLEMAYTVLAFWAVMLIVSPIWLAFFRFGPLEWVWRSLTYKKAQPFLKARQAELA